MPRQNLQQQMYGLTGPSTAQRLTLSALLGCSVVLAWWLLLGGGIGIVSQHFGRYPAAAHPARCLALAVALSIYFVRVLFTLFLFLRRGVSWNEVVTIALWVLILCLLLAFGGGTNPAPLGAAAMAGAALFVLGSSIHSCAEYQRHAWKSRPENRGKLYTQGLFRLTRHPNYLGDLILFSGLCLLAGRWFLAVIPAIMLCGFVFINIPALDAHLSEHYGAAFDRYASRTKKLIPLLY